MALLSPSRSQTALAPNAFYSGRPAITMTVSSQPQLTSARAGKASTPMTAADKTEAGVDGYCANAGAKAIRFLRRSRKVFRAYGGERLRKLMDLAFDELAEARWQESRPAEADNMDVGPATETDLQGDLIEASGNPF